MVVWNSSRVAVSLWRDPSIMGEGLTGEKNYQKNQMLLKS